MIGQVLADRYKIIEEVGIGGMAIVYKAEDLLLRREVAIKVLKDQYSEDSEFSDKFEIEAQSAASLTYPNIVSIYDVGSEKIGNRNVQYIVMELIKGKTLKEIIVDKGHLSNEEAVDYSKQIAEALKAAHKNNIIHRDIKPQNIMVTEEGMAKVTDFGIARISTSATITYTSSILGTVHYISPEQAKGKFIDYKSDLYSLGIVMYEMVTGRVPFDAENSVGIALKHIQDEVMAPKKINPDVSDKLNDIILKCLEKNPADRYLSAQDLIDDLNSKDIYLVTDLEETQSFNIPEEDNISIYASNNTRVDEEDQKPRTLRNILLTAILALVVVTVAFFALSSIKDRMTESLIIVPDVLNKSEDEAVATLEGMDLDYNIIRRENKDVLEGFVFEQEPVSGTEGDQDSTVFLVVSDKEEEVLMPNILGRSIEEARDILASESMTIDSERYEESSAEEGTVISQTPEPGDKISNQSQVSLVISQGEKEYATMPDILGSSQTAAVSSIIDSGLVVGDIERMYSDEYPEGTVMWQMYDEGVELERGTTVDLIVSSGSLNSSNIAVPPGTIDLTGGAQEGDMKLYTLSIEPPKDRDNFDLKIIRVMDGSESVVYEENHNSTSSFDLNFKDYSSARLDVYYDDELVASTR